MRSQPPPIAYEKSTYSGEEMLRRDPVDQVKTQMNVKTRMYGIESVEELSKKLE